MLLASKCITGSQKRNENYQNAYFLSLPLLIFVWFFLVFFSKIYEYITCYFPSYPHWCGCPLNDDLMDKSRIGLRHVYSIYMLCLKSYDRCLFFFSPNRRNEMEIYIIEWVIFKHAQKNCMYRFGGFYWMGCHQSYIIHEEIMFMSYARRFSNMTAAFQSATAITKSYTAFKLLRSLSKSHSMLPFNDR